MWWINILHRKCKLRAKYDQLVKNYLQVDKHEQLMEKTNQLVIKLDN